MAISYKPLQHLSVEREMNSEDEFYTQLVDIERELKYYKTHFRDKVVYCHYYIYDS